MKVLDFKPRLFSALKNYSKETFMADLMAGIIVGIVALPLAIAFGIASGVSPEKVLCQDFYGKMIFNYRNIGMLLYRFTWRQPVSLKLVDRSSSLRRCCRQTLFIGD